jgi:hypothetical protein
MKDTIDDRFPGNKVYAKTRNKSIVAATTKPKVTSGYTNVGYTPNSKTKTVATRPESSEAWGATAMLSNMRGDATSDAANEICFIQADPDKPGSNNFNSVARE